MTSQKTKANVITESDTFTCETCHKIFPSHRGLKRHIRRNHEGTKFQCYHCTFSTKFKECLVRHVQLHLFKKVVVCHRGAYVKCPLCEFGCVAREVMIKHYADDHDVDMKEEYFEFPGTEEFLKWKYEIEQADVCQFTSRSKKNRDAAQIRYYRCFRDGIFQRKGKGIRNMKLKGSLKINGICPAGMKVEENKATGFVQVTFVRSHVGHSHELGLLNLSKSERAEIARKLSMGMSHEEILGGIRGTMDANVKRVHLITRKDVWNVQSSLGLPKARTKRVKQCKATEEISKDDQMSIEDIKGSECSKQSGIVETEGGNVCNINVPVNPGGTILEHGLQEQSKSIEASGTHVWGIQYWAEPQEPDNFYSAQSVPGKANVTKNCYDLDDTKNLPNTQHKHARTEECESSNDDDGHYFEVVTPDPPDDRLVPLQNQLNEKKTKIGTKVEEILDIVKTEAQADIFYNELLQIQEAILAHSSVAGNFNVAAKL